MKPRRIGGQDNGVVFELCQRSQNSLMAVQSISSPIAARLTVRLESDHIRVRIDLAKDCN